MWSCMHGSCLHVRLLGQQWVGLGLTTYMLFVVT